MTTIRLNNTKTRKREDFVPIDPQNVRLYLCGPTVYDRAHLGNARPSLVFDVLFRLLREIYGADHVTYVRNFTDVDDKINARAAASGRAIGDITAETIGWYHDDMDALGILRPSHEPRATEHIPQMIAMIADLEAKGHAYAAEGHVLFAVDSYADYGALSGRTIDDMIAGARVEVAPYKRNPMDFVLWKPSCDGVPGWDSPWGYGRPGWHIECSAMSHALLGDSFDIHGGGNDLQFPHHENEIAQSTCAHPHGEFARYWVHNEMLQVEGKKMSKSLVNFFTIRDLLDQGVPGEVIRLVMLGTGYQKSMDWTRSKAAQAERTLRKWRTLCYGQKPSQTVPRKIIDCVADNLNTVSAFYYLRELARDGNAADLLAGAQFVGLLTDELGSWFELGAGSISDDQNLDWILNHRGMLRRNKRWEEADALRVFLRDHGVVVADGRDSSNGYIEPELLMRRLMSNLFHAANDGDTEAAKSAKLEAIEFGITRPEPRAWSGREAEKLLPVITQKIAELRKRLEVESHV